MKRCATCAKGCKAYEFLLEKNELESATKRLAEAFTVGECVPEIRTLPREKKRQALEFVQKSNQLISAMEVKDYTHGGTAARRPRRRSRRTSTTRSRGP